MIRIVLVTLIAALFSINTAQAACMSADFTVSIPNGTDGVAELIYVGDGASCVSNYAIDWGDGTVTTGINLYPGAVFYHTYTSNGPHTITMTTNSNQGACEGTCNATYEGEVYVEGFCCGKTLSLKGMTTNVGSAGEFYYNQLTGQFVFVRADCSVAEYPFDCFYDMPIPPELEGVISASATVFSDDWLYDKSLYYPNYSNQNDVERGMVNKWRTRKEFDFREKLDQSIINTVAIDDYKNYDRGTFVLEMFNWKNEGVFNDPEKWMLHKATNYYMPNGKAEEDENIIGVKSTAIFGYDNTVPIGVAQNAGQNTIRFESFERKYTSGGDDYFENGLPYDVTNGTWSDEQAHTGKYSIKLKQPADRDTCGFIISKLTVNQHVLDEGLMVRFWIYVDKDEPELDNSQPDANIWLGLNRIGGTWNWHTCITYYGKIASSGPWSLYQAYISPGVFSWLPDWEPGQQALISVRIQDDNKVTWGVGNTYQEGDIYIDDVRVQPYYSEMTCYVYDDAQRLTAVFDDQHFGMFYEYNMQGELVRKLKETERGVKTISETQYSTYDNNPKW